MVKYQIYVECLEQSIQFRRVEQQERTEELENELQHLEVDDDDDDYHHYHHDYDHHRHLNRRSRNSAITKNEGAKLDV
jgi:hypothetical protein